MDWTSLPGRSLVPGLASVSQIFSGSVTANSLTPTRRTDDFGNVLESKEKTNILESPLEENFTRKASAGAAYTSPMSKANASGQSEFLAFFTVTSNSYAIVVQLTGGTLLLSPHHYSRFLFFNFSISVVRLMPTNSAALFLTPSACSKASSISRPSMASRKSLS